MKSLLITLSYTPLSCAQRRMKAFLFQRYALPSAPPSLRSSHLWLLQSIRRESLSHKVANPDFQRSKAWCTAFSALYASFLCSYLVACSIVLYNVCGRIGFYWSLFNTACMRCLLACFPIRRRCLLRTRVHQKNTAFVRISPCSY